MSDKSNPFRDSVRQALEKIGLEYLGAFPNGASIDLYSKEGRWLAVMHYQSREDPHWWNIPHIFEALRALERQYRSYLVAGFYQDEPEAGWVLTGVELEPLYRAGVNRADRAGNVKIKPDDFRGAVYLRGAERIAAYLRDTLLDRPQDPALRPEQLVPVRPRRCRPVPAILLM